MGSISANTRPSRHGYWSGLLTGFTLLLSFSLPLEQMAYHADLTHPVLMGIRWLGHLFFIIDFAWRWRRGDYRRGAEGRGWFAVDLLAALPLGPLAFLSAPGAPAGLLSLIHILPVVRLTRVVVATREWQQSNPARTAVRRIISTITAILLLIHWIGCWQMAVYQSGQEVPFLLRYLHAVYWTTTTMTTIGYGDITPDKSQPAEILFTMLIMIIGAGAFGFIIGNIATIMASIDFARNQHLERMQRINAFMRYNNLPERLSDKINHYYSHLWRMRKGFDESAILADLPAELRQEVEMHLRRDIVAKVPFFRDAGAAMLRAIVSRLKPQIAFPGEAIIRRGELGDCMYFIAAGTVEVLGPDGETVATLTEGGFFGEIALVEQRPRGADVRAAGFCDLYKLDKSALDEVIAQHPDFGRHIREIALARSTPPR